MKKLNEKQKSKLVSKFLSTEDGFKKILVAMQNPIDAKVHYFNKKRLKLLCFKDETGINMISAMAEIDKKKLKGLNVYKHLDSIKEILIKELLKQEQIVLKKYQADYIIIKEMNLVGNLIVNKVIVYETFYLAKVCEHNSKIEKLIKKFMDKHEKKTR